MRFARKRQKVALKSTLASLVLACLSFAAVFRWGVKIPFFAFILPLTVFFIHSFMGYYLNLYNKTRFFDRALHAFASFSFALFGYFLLSNFLDFGGSKAFLALFVLLLGFSVGALYEIFEFFCDLKSAKKLQRGLRDTDADLLCDLLGSIAAAALAYFLLL